jgi:hypothetical protein
MTNIGLKKLAFARKELMPRKTKIFLFQMILAFLIFPAIAPAAEYERFRVLSISDSEKLILVSRIPGKKKFLLDASSVKITLAGKAMEFKDLKQYSVIQVKMEAGKKTRNGTDLDGIVTEIIIPGLGSAK